MNRIIYKYQINVTDVNTVLMPEGAEVLTVQMQDAVPCIWAMVDLDKPRVERFFGILGTGNPVPDDFKGKYIGTFQERIFVWHLYELVE